MKIYFNDVLIKAATLLNKNELALYIKNGYSNDMVASEEDLEQERTKLLYSFAEVYTEIACDYIPLYYTQTITVSNGQFDLSTLTKKIKTIKSITDINGVQTKDYQLENDYLIIKNGTYKIKYRFIPLVMDVYQDDIQNFDGKVNEGLMAYGTLAYYCLMYNLTDLYEVWETKYRHSLLIAMQKTENLYIKPRRFV